MTTDIQLQRAGRVQAHYNQEIPEAGGDVAPDAPLPPPSANAASEAEVRAQLEALAARYAQSNGFDPQNPELFMVALANMVQSSSESTNRTQLEATAAQREAHVRLQTEAAAKAEAAQKDAGFWSTFAKIAGYVGTALGAIALVAGAIATGGALAIAAAAVGVAAAATTLTAKALTDTGVIDATSSKALGIAATVLGIVSAAMSLGVGAGGLLATVGSVTSIASQSGQLTCDILELTGIQVPDWVKYTLMGASLVGAGMNAASAFSRGASQGAQIVNTAARTAQNVARISAGAAQVAQGVGTGGAAVYTHTADQERVTSKREGGHIARLSRETSEITEQLRDVYEQTQRMNDRSMEMMSARNTARMAMNRNMLRGLQIRPHDQ